MRAADHVVVPDASMSAYCCHDPVPWAKTIKPPAALAVLHAQVLIGRSNDA